MLTMPLAPGSCFAADDLLPQTKIQNDYMDEHRRRHGRRFDHEERTYVA